MAAPTEYDRIGAEASSLTARRGTSSTRLSTVGLGPTMACCLPARFDLDSPRSSLEIGPVRGKAPPSPGHVHMMVIMRNGLCTWDAGPSGDRSALNSHSAGGILHMTAIQQGVYCT